MNPHPPGQRWLTVNLHRVGDDHVVAVADGSETDRQFIDEWLESAMKDRHIRPVVFLIRPTAEVIDPAPRLIGVAR